jgi:hypothetical protein
MFSWNVKKVHVAQYPIDFRKQHQSLLAEAFALDLDLWSGDLVVFLNRYKTGVKMLLADDTGIWLLYKKMSRGSIKTKICEWGKQGKHTITRSELMMLLEGTQYEVKKYHRKWRPGVDI